MTRYLDFHIHGDNIVECERTFDIIKSAITDQLESIIGPNGSPVCPEFQIHLKNMGNPLNFTFYPGFGRWNEDILQFVRERGGILREAADAIITGVVSQSEEPLIAIEYCGALPAGNQAWQRNGRAFSFGLARIPYLYIAELGGYELDSNRNRKAPRMPNPAVPFSYLSYSLEQGIPVLPIFIANPGADESSIKEYGDEFAKNELISLLRAVILDENPNEMHKILRQKVLSFIKKRAASSRQGTTLNPQQWENAYSSLEEGQTLVEFLVHTARLEWSKTAYIAALTDTANALMELASSFAIGLTSNALPMCIIPRTKRSDFASRVSALYTNLPQNFAQWLARDEHLVICWVMGFKPRGDDARPDRGLPPLTRMLIGSRCDLLSVVYGPAPTATWSMLRDDPATLMERNGLWEAILAVSNALLVDTATDQVTTHGFLRSHWQTAIPRPSNPKIFVRPLLAHVGENDVDTVLHTIFARFASKQAYECMCNPPGGDWSGISLQTPDRSLELRWLSLPRVSGTNTKRPDHVFQLFGISPRPIVFSVESKEDVIVVEKHIGPRLSKYVVNLISSPASIERKNPSYPWHQSTNRLNSDDFVFASSVAFIPASQSHMDSVIDKIEADLILVFEFQTYGQSCSIRLIPKGKIGEIIGDYISRLNLSASKISLSRAHSLF